MDIYGIIGTVSIFARVGSNECVVDSTKNPVCPPGHVEMNAERPDENHIATESGEWVKTDKFLMEDLLRRRDAKLAATDWMVQRHREQVERGKKVTLSLKSANYTDLLEYRQALRDLPQKYKTSDEWQWPAAPAFLTELLSSGRHFPALEV